MPGSRLRHLAVVADGALGPPDAPGGGAAAAISRAAAVAAAAFAEAGELEAISFVAPGIDRLLGDPARRAGALQECLAGGRDLAEAASRLGASLRLCGRTEELSADLLALGAPAGPAGERTILWFLRYGGRDEIARAATRWLRAHPGRPLGDDDLDAWLDTAGVPDPDLIVLAGGALEPPDALVWQGSYAEIWHTPTSWAGFGPEELRRALADYRERQRRFGR